eukprot:m.797270 g.797270  ORF g.797270 m.797270 type:complete len:197 (-) comp23345_c1_seq40:2909-3499(-)
MASRAVRLLDPCDVCLHWCSVMYTYRHRNYCGHHHQSQQCCRVNEHIPIGIHVAPFPYCHRCPQQSTTGCCGRAIDEMELLLKQQSTPQETCAVVIEPVLGEGGYVPAPKPFLRDLHQLCKENDILFIADEVQSGFGRTGNFFVSEPSCVVLFLVLGYALLVGDRYVRRSIRLFLRCLLASTSCSAPAACVGSGVA